MANERKQQHYLAKFYLKRFADPEVPPDWPASDPWEPPLWVYEWGSRGPIRRSPKKTARQLGTYRVLDENGDPDDAYEDILQGLESDVAPLLRRLDVSHALSARDREMLALFVASMDARVPQRRAETEELGERVTAGYRTIMDNRPDVRAAVEAWADANEAEPVEATQAAIWRELKGLDGSFQANQTVHVATSAMLAAEAAEIFARMKWELLIAGVDTPYSRFITSDAPVTLHNPRGPAGLLMSAIRVHLPLSPRLCARISWDGGEGWRTAGVEEVAKVNTLIIAGAERFVFADYESTAIAHAVSDHMPRPYRHMIRAG